MNSSSQFSSKIQQVINDLMAYEPEKIILFGSTFIQRLVEAASFVSPYISVDILVYTPAELKAMIEAENPFIQQAFKEGKVLYEKAAGDSPSLAGPG
jgi:hypothetical protein